MAEPLIPVRSLESLARKFKLGNYAGRSGARDDGHTDLPREPALVQEGDAYVFLNLPYQSKILPKVALTPLLENGAAKTHDQWREYAASNQQGISIPNTIVWYQLLRQLYYLRSQEECQEAVESCVAALRNDFDRLYLHTGTKVSYGSGLEALIDHLEEAKISSLIELTVPEFARATNDWSYLRLASEQSASALGTVNALPSEALPVLETFFGDGYEEAGAVFQYVASRKGNDQNLREVRFWVPTASNRNTERCVVLCVYGDWFNIDAVGYFSDLRPARGVVVPS